MITRKGRDSSVSTVMFTILGRHHPLELGGTTWSRLASPGVSITKREGLSIVLILGTMILIPMSRMMMPTLFLVINIISHIKWWARIITGSGCILLRERCSWVGSWWVLYNFVFACLRMNLILLLKVILSKPCSQWRGSGSVRRSWQ